NGLAAVNKLEPMEYDQVYELADHSTVGAPSLTNADSQFSQLSKLTNSDTQLLAGQWAKTVRNRSVV
ncbi:MAG: hypothetical protein ACKPKO_52105, partial [Candidatus Fonsibacter sp.]